MVFCFLETKMSIHLISGPMFSGKTKNLLHRLKKYEDRDVILIKHSSDARYSVTPTIISHGGEKRAAIILKNLNEITKESNLFLNSTIFAIDEGQFFTDIIETTQQWAAHGKHVIISSLSSGIFMQPISHIAKLMSKSDKVTILQGTCKSCLGRASFTYRLTPFSEYLEPRDPHFYLGSALEYAPLCRRCFIKRLQYDFKSKEGMFSNKGYLKIASAFDFILKMNTNIIGET